METDQRLEPDDKIHAPTEIIPVAPVIILKFLLKTKLCISYQRSQAAT